MENRNFGYDSPDFYNFGEKENFGELFERRLPFLSLTVGHLVVQLFVLYIVYTLSSKNEDLKKSLKSSANQIVMIICLFVLMLGLGFARHTL